MKNTWRTFGTLSLGIALAFGMTNSVATAAEPDTSKEVLVDSKLVDINLPKLPILGEVKVSIPSTKTDEENQSLISVEVNDGILDEVNVDVGTKSETTEGGTKESLATVEVKSSITNDVTVDVGVADEKDHAYDGGLVEVNAEDLPLLGETHVGVIDKHAKDGESQTVSSGLAQVDIDGNLLEDTSVQVLAADKTIDADGDENSNAVADVSIGGGILDGIVDEADVPVLKRSESKMDGTKLSKSSIASVGLASDLTEDVQVDVGSAQSQTDEDSMSFDGGLVDVNASDLPLLGETHVGVLDKHVNVDEESLSFSSGLVQVGVDGDLIEDTNVDVLYKNGEMTEDGLLVTNGVVGTNLGLTGIDPITVDIVKTEELYPIGAVTPPSTGGGDGDDGNTVPPTVIVPVPGDDDGNEDGNTVPPTVIEPVPDDGNTVPPTVIVPVPGGNGNEDGNAVPPAVIVPVPGDENDSSIGNGSGTDGNENGSMNPDSNEDGTAVVPGDGSETPPATDNGEVDADSGERDNGTVDGTMPGKNQSSTNGGKRVLSASVIKEAINSQPTRGSLPQTGGIFDGKRLAVLAVLLLISGAGLRKFGKSGQPAA
ncbi:hypothetical protein H9649_09745 [Sporosarcina sp. Sa2YVA2]|uniref:Gram-positive cocci surface proteins LPxTG domain-containing protein n=1 Tax=Sporosarcina quadrami TaxID=2762234 RepID=A0ABR8UA03_9BACL|nr:hypothetical protein [Sporosarcina quadrami]MBD7984866.1 hypothetical protein [Sporosarcina quadrami]